MLRYDTVYIKKMKKSLPSTENEGKSVDSTQRFFDVFLSGQNQGKTPEFEFKNIFENAINA